MIEALKFVRGAVAKKDYQPVLTHFRIKDGRVTGYNGIVALSSPIDIDLDATPKEKPFVQAIERCKGTTALHMTPGGKLALKSGSFRAFVDCAPDSELLDAIVPVGKEIPVATSLIPAISAISRFIGTDASRPWATGLLFRGFSAYTTNNIIVAEHWIGEGMPEVNLPVAAIAELERIKEEPSSVLMDENSMTFFFSGGRWMRTQILGLDWPDVAPLLNVESNQKPLPKGFFEAVETLKPFVEEEGRVYFRSGRITTSSEEGAGASVDFEGLPERGAFHINHLLSLDGVAETIDFDKHPLPGPFFGGKTRGILLGMIDQ